MQRSPAFVEAAAPSAHGKIQYSVKLPDVTELATFLPIAAGLQPVSYWHADDD